MDKASVILDGKRGKNIKEKLASERKEKAGYAKKGWSTHHAGGLNQKI